MTGFSLSGLDFASCQSKPNRLKPAYWFADSGRIKTMSLEVAIEKKVQDFRLVRGIHSGRRSARLAGLVGFGQDDDAARDRRPGDAGPRADRAARARAVRFRGGHQRARARAPHRPAVPELRVVPAPDRCGKYRLRIAAAVDRGAQSTRGTADRRRAPRWPGKPLSRHAIRRRTAARGAGARAGHRARRTAARRAVFRAGYALAQRARAPTSRDAGAVSADRPSSSATISKRPTASAGIWWCCPGERGGAQGPKEEIFPPSPNARSCAAYRMQEFFRALAAPPTAPSKRSTGAANFASLSTLRSRPRTSPFVRTTCACARREN